VSTNRAVETVTSFLRLVEERRLDEAALHLADDVTITFPGGRTFSSLEEQVVSSAGRFRSVRKVFERFDVVEVDESIIIYSFGTLEGEGLDGRSFSGVRYIDRFVLRDGLIVDQKVWNDLGETDVIGGGAD
jgi:hypothetical protein